MNIISAFISNAKSLCQEINYEFKNSSQKMRVVAAGTAFTLIALGAADVAAGKGKVLLACWAGYGVMACGHALYKKYRRARLARQPGQGPSPR